jgi:hypothetical protein
MDASGHGPEAPGSDAGSSAPPAMPSASAPEPPGPPRASQGNPGGAGDPPPGDAQGSRADAPEPQKPSNAQRGASETLTTISTLALTTAVVTTVSHLKTAYTLVIVGIGVAALLIASNPGDIRHRVSRAWHLPRPRARRQRGQRRQRRQRRLPTAPAGKDAKRPRRAGANRWLAAGVATATALAFLVGYWVIGKGFAHGLLTGICGLLGVVLAGALTLAWSRRHRAPGWVSWLRPWRNCTLAVCVSAVGLSAGGALGHAGHQPGPAPAASCPSPTELRVLASTEILGPLQTAITEFEQDERTVLHTSCYAIDIWAYAAANDKAADKGIAADEGIADGWNLADGPRPDIWIPASTEELPTRKPGAGQPILDPHGSIASSPIVIAVPCSLVTPALRESAEDATLATLYQAVSADHLALQVPNPRLSETGRLGVADLYPARTSVKQTSFPPDSDSLLGQAAATGRSAYLASAAAVFANNHGDLTSTCPSQPAAQQLLTTFSPVDGSVLDFPFATVTWPGVSVPPARAAAERNFLHWLTGKAGQKALQGNGLGPAGVAANLPPEADVSAAVYGFTQIQPSARILIAIDDSGPMQFYLGQIAQAVDSVLGPRAQGGNLSGRDSFGIWTFPGPGADTERVPVPLKPNTPAQRALVQGAVTAITAHGHSAEFDLVYDAALALNRDAPSGSASSIVLLTDGDSQQTDRNGHKIGDITTLLSGLTPGNLPIKLYVIGFGPAGCAETPSGLAADSLNALAKAGGTVCVAEQSGSLQKLLAQDISTLSTGGVRS